MGKPGAKPFLLKTILVLVSIVAGLAVAEVALRMLGIYATYTEKNGRLDYTSAFTPQEEGWLHIYQPHSKHGIHSGEFQHFVNANSVGLDDVEWPLHKQKPVRIACFGDSFTEGVGATHDSSYAAQLQQMLDTAEVLKCGVSGSDPFFGYMLLKQKLLDYHPDIVFMTVNSTDIPETIIRGGFERFGTDGKTHYAQAPWWEPAYAKCYLLRLFVHKVLGYNLSLFTAKEWDLKRQKAIRDLQNCIDKTETLCRQNNIRCAFVFNPMQHEMRRDTFEYRPLQLYTQQKGYEAVDIAAFFKAKGVGAENLEKYYWKKDAHNTALGYTLLAQALAAQLADKQP